MASKLQIAVGAIVAIAIVAIIGYFLTSGGGSSSGQSNGTTTVDLGCPSDGDGDGEASTFSATTYVSTGKTTVANGSCVIDEDGDGV